jgi:hypothetical protein
MKIFFDQGTPAPLRLSLAEHEVSTAHEMGWSQLKNGELLKALESVFDAMITTDKNLRYQQNLKDRKLAILVLPTTSWPKIQQHISEVQASVASLQPGAFLELNFGS